MPSIVRAHTSHARQNQRNKAACVGIQLGFKFNAGEREKFASRQAARDAAGELWPHQHVLIFIVCC